MPEMGLSKPIHNKKSLVLTANSISRTHRWVKLALERLLSEIPKHFFDF